MGCVQSLFRKAQPSGASPSPTEESTNKVVENEPTIQNDPKSTVSIIEEKPSEEPESNDTSYGVEATAVRTLAASTGTVAILGTTAKVKEEDEENAQDESIPKIVKTEQETIESVENTNPSMVGKDVSANVSIEEIKTTEIPEITLTAEEEKVEAEDEEDLKKELQPLKSEDFSKDREAKIVGYQEKKDKNPIEKNEKESQIVTENMDLIPEVVSEGENIEKAKSEEVKNSDEKEGVTAKIEDLEKSSSSVIKNNSEDMILKGVTVGENAEKAKIEEEMKDSAEKEAETVTIKDLGECSYSIVKNSSEDIKMTESEILSADISKTDDENEISSEQLRTNSLSDMSISDTLNSELEEAAREAAKAQELREMVASLSSSANKTDLDYDYSDLNVGTSSKESSWKEVTSFNDGPESEENAQLIPPESPEADEPQENGNQHALCGDRDDMEKYEDNLDNSEEILAADQLQENGIQHVFSGCGDIEPFEGALENIEQSKELEQGDLKSSNECIPDGKNGRESFDNSVLEFENLKGYESIEINVENATPEENEEEFTKGQEEIIPHENPSENKPEKVEKKSENDEPELVAAATAIQSGFRGYQARKQLKETGETDATSELKEMIIEKAKHEVDEICRQAEMATEAMTARPIPEDDEEFPAPPDDLMDPGKNVQKEDQNNSETPSTEATMPLGNHTEDTMSSKTEDTTAPSIANSEVKSMIEAIPLIAADNELPLESSTTNEVNTEVVLNPDSTEGEVTTEEEIENAAVIIQAGVRGYLARKAQKSGSDTTDSDEVSKEEKAYVKAATTIQAGYRGFKTRKLIREGSSERNTEEETSQSELTNGRPIIGPEEEVSHQNVPEPDSSNTGEKLSAPSSEILNRSATKIQAGVRGYLARKKQKSVSKSKSAPQLTTQES